MRGSMKSRLGPALVAILTGATLATGGHGAAVASPSSSVHRAGTTVLHRVVWDQDLRGRPGVHLRSARLDGSHAHPIYTSHRGFTIALTLDRRGRRVAFAPCCRSSLPALVVVPVLGGPAEKPLAHHPEFYDVGGIGWSPHGTRLVFEGYVKRHDRLTEALWTVRPDGSGLHRMLRLPDPTVDSSGPNEALAWTSEGVLYCQGGSLRIASHGRSRVLIRSGVFSVRISGDGRHIVTERYDRENSRGSVWYGDADGTHQRRLWLGPRPTTSTTSTTSTYGYPVPDFHGRRLLTERQDIPSDARDGVVGWRVGTDPDRAKPLGFLAQSFAFAWN